MGQETITRHVRVQGKVQGVGYRWSCVSHAKAAGVTGWVRNRIDGSVEALLQGPRGKVEAMMRWMLVDVPNAQVTRLDADEAPAEAGLQGFEERPTA